MRHPAGSDTPLRGAVRVLPHGADPQQSRPSPENGSIEKPRTAIDSRPEGRINEDPPDPLRSHKPIPMQHTPSTP